MTEPQNRLKMPEGVAMTGPVQDLTEAYVKAVVALPEMLNFIAGELQGINDSLSLLSLYLERKGLSEKLFSDEDLKEDGDGKQEPPAA